MRQKNMRKLQEGLRLILIFTICKCETQNAESVLGWQESMWPVISLHTYFFVKQNNYIRSVKNCKVAQLLSY